MSFKLKQLSIIMAIIALIVGLMTMTAVAADNNYRELPVQNNISPEKTNWPIKFTMPIDQQTVNENNIYIVNQEDQTRVGVRFELSSDKKTIYVVPKIQYAVNSTYQLFIEAGICSDTNPACYLSQKAVMTFTTIKDNYGVLPVPQISPLESAANITTLDAQSLADLGEVSRGLTKAISTLTVQAEKDVALAIKGNIDKKIADPTFDHTSEISSIKDRYHSLTPEQKEELQNAILYDVTLQSLIRLADYFGFN